ncbi:hypothetical protein LCGC14_1691920 [marine sediment metagenome]|uniref:Uncharacterized protein n=1 Tax=marine sediment metagenome TaxID=412755 RepID=A0A0F9HKI0_9ZZZZ
MITEKDLQKFKTLLNEKIQDNLIKMPTDISTGRLSALGACNEALGRVDETLRQLQENCDVVLQKFVIDKKPYENLPMKVKRLIYKDVPSHGKEIYANVSKTTNCVEATLSRIQPVLQKDAIIGYEPWIQFEPEERDKMMDKLFMQLVDAWNEKYGELE